MMWPLLSRGLSEVEVRRRCPQQPLVPVGRPSGGKVKRFIRWELMDEAISSSRGADEFTGQRTNAGIPYLQRKIEALRVSHATLQVSVKPRRSRSE